MPTNIGLSAVAKVLSVSFLVASVGACSASASDDDSLATTSADLSGNQGTAYKYFIGRGLSKDQAAAVVGNLIQESSVLPGSVQYGGGPGRGIAQWSVGGRWNHDSHDNVEWYAESKKQSATSLELQLDFVWYELETFSGYGLSRLKAAKTLDEATIAFQDDFEGCGECDQSKRIEYAQQVLSAYGGGGGGGGSNEGSSSGEGCYSSTLGQEMPNNACVQSRSDHAWYQCDKGSWVDRWNDPAACDGIHPL